MEKAKIKLFGVEIKITVSKTDEEVYNNSASSSEYSSILTGDPTISRKSKKRAFDDDFNNTNNNLLPFKKRFSEEIHQDPSYASSSSTCDDDDVILDDNKVHRPMPLRCYFPPMGMFFSASQLGFSRNNKPSQENKKKNNAAKSRATFDKSIPPPVLPLEKIPGLMERIGSENGSTTKPVFLYKKKLQESDVKPHLNRLFIPAGRCNIELVGFLRDEEKAAIASETRKGLEFFGMDKNGEIYNLRLAKWDSLRMNVINKEWTRMVKANDAQEGDWVELWGYRLNNNDLRLVINFRKSEPRNADGTSS